MALFLQLLPLLLSRSQGDPRAALNGHPGDRVNLSCVGVSHPLRWAWAPSFPVCKGLSKGRRPILWASSGGTPTVSPLQPFGSRLRALDPGVRRLELLLSSGDSGTFICIGKTDESRTALHVLGDGPDCGVLRPGPGSVYTQLLMALLGAGLVLGLVALGLVCWWRRCSAPHSLPPLPRLAPLSEQPRRPAKEEEEPEVPGEPEPEPSLHYADLDPLALRRPFRPAPAAPDASTVYAVVV